jgi:hypothetical protein
MANRKTSNKSALWCARCLRRIVSASLNLRTDRYADSAPTHFSTEVARNGLLGRAERDSLLGALEACFRKQ